MAAFSFSSGTFLRSRASAVGCSIAPNTPWAPGRDDQGDAAGDAPRQADGRRAGREPGHPGQEYLLVPEPVPGLPGGDQADRQGQQVGVGHPLDAGQGGVQAYWMAGLATATIVPSMPTIITPIATASSVSAGCPASGRTCRRRPGAGGRGGGGPPGPWCLS